MSKAEENIIKICGKNCNCNFDVIHTRKIINMLTSYYRENDTDYELMEIIAGLTFAITSDLDCILEEENSIKEDKNKTEQNIDKLYSFLYGGYRDE